MKDSTRSRLASLSVCVPQKSGGVGLYESRIEVVLADQQGKLIPQTGLTVVRAISIVVFVSMTRIPGRVVVV